MRGPLIEFGIFRNINKPYLGEILVKSSYSKVWDGMTRDKMRRDGMRRDGKRRDDMRWDEKG